ncbi:MAG: hypothetical protein KDB61_11340, partial [Planctomycetes bacterium]|nr:hypothetical protein [Planctomycetota bacterium]
MRPNLGSGNPFGARHSTLHHGSRKVPNTLVIQSPIPPVASRSNLPEGATALLASPRRIHLLGVGGAGVSGAARLLAGMGHSLSGHDREPSAFS